MHSHSFIRPLSTSQLIDLPFMLMRVLGARLIRVHVLGAVPALIALAAVLWPMAPRVPTNADMVLDFFLLSSWFELGLLRALAIPLALSLLVFPAAAGTHMLAWHILGREVGTRAAFADTWRAALRLWPVFVAGMSLHTLALVLAVSVPCIGLIGWSIAYLFIHPFFSFTTHTVVLEGLGSRAALRRTWRLCKPSAARVSWHALVNTITFSFAMTIPALLSGYLFSFVLEASTDFEVATVYAVAAVVGVLLAGLIPAASTLAYYDLRARSEGLDLELELLAQPKLIRRSLAPGGDA